MEIIPAIDLKDGKCVRLYQGDYEKETIFAENPVDTAVHWVAQGATRIHVVDLDGAKDGAPANMSVIEKIVTSVDAPVQVGGGIRTLETAKRLLKLGVGRVLIGTAAIEQPELVRQMCAELGGKSIVVTVDARDGYVAVKGWTQSSKIKATELVEQMAGLGVSRFLYTDIARDGTLTEPNFLAIQELVETSRLPIIAAGGVSSVEQVLKLAAIGAEGAIAGTALYTGKLDLKEAVAALKQSQRD